MLQLTVALDIVLTAGEVPHEIAPIHEVDLIGEEEADVLQLRGHLHHNRLSAAVEGHFIALHATHPVFVGLGMTVGIHAWEEHVLRIDVFDVVALHFIAVGLVGGSLLLTLVHRCAFLRHGHAVAAIGLQLHLRGVGLSVEEWTVAILLTAQVLAQGEDVLGRVLVHGRVGRGADHDDGVRRVADHDHQHAQQRSVHQPCGDELLAVLLPVQAEIEYAEHDDAKHHALPAIAVERDAQHGHAGQERQVHAQAATLLCTLPDSPYNHGDEADDIDDEAGVEGAVERVDEQQLEPAAHLHDARHDAVENGGHEHE